MYIDCQISDTYTHVIYVLVRTHIYLISIYITVLLCICINLLMYRQHQGILAKDLFKHEMEVSQRFPYIIINECVFTSLLYEKEGRRSVTYNKHKNTYQSKFISNCLTTSML